MTRFETGSVVGTIMNAFREEREQRRMTCAWKVKLFAGIIWIETLWAAFVLRLVQIISGEWRWRSSNGCDYSLLHGNVQCGGNRMGFWGHHNHSIGVCIDSRSVDDPTSSTTTFSIHKQFQLWLIIAQSVIIKIYPIHQCNFHSSSGVIKTNMLKSHFFLCCNFLYIWFCDLRT